jgi:hypothetical protein
MISEQLAGIIENDGRKTINVINKFVNGNDFSRKRTEVYYQIVE